MSGRERVIDYTRRTVGRSSTYTLAGSQKESQTCLRRGTHAFPGRSSRQAMRSGRRCHSVPPDTSFAWTLEGRYRLLPPHQTFRELRGKHGRLGVPGAVRESDSRPTGQASTGPPHAVRRDPRGRRPHRGNRGLHAFRDGSTNKRHRRLDEAAVPPFDARRVSRCLVPALGSGIAQGSRPASRLRRRRRPVEWSAIRHRRGPDEEANAHPPGQEARHGADETSKGRHEVESMVRSACLDPRTVKGNPASTQGDDSSTRRLKATKAVDQMEDGLLPFVRTVTCLPISLLALRRRRQVC